MSQRARVPKTSPSESKKNSISIRKITRSSVIKKSSPIKRHLEQTSTTITQPRQKRLSSLTATTLLQYCTSILSPSRKRKSTPDNSKAKKTKPIIDDKNTPSSQRQISNVSDNKPSQTETIVRTRREASSHASAMILQQNEIERSHYNYEHSTSLIRRQNTKSIITNKDDISPVTSITNVSNPTNSKQQSLTEALLAEHNRLHEKIHSKRDNLIKWTEELALCSRLSPPYPKHETTTSSAADLKSLDSNTSTTNPTPTFLFPSAAHPLDLRSFYSLLPCWQYPNSPFQSRVSLQTKKSTTFISKSQSIAPVHKRKEETSRLHLHTSANSLSLLKSSNPTKVPSSLQKPSVLVNTEQPVETKTTLPLNVNNIVQKEHQQITLTAENEVLNLSTNLNEQDGVVKKTTRRKSSPVKRHVNGGLKSTRSSSPLISDEASHTINSIKTSPRKTVDSNQIVTSPPLSNILRTNGNLPVDDQKAARRVLKPRSVSAAVASSPTIISITDKNSRGNRTTSASNIPLRVKSLTNRKRLHSPASISLPLSNKTPSQRKKQKVTHHWVLFGKSEQKLVSIHADRLPVYRKCYSSIRHRTEKDVIKSNDCVILRPETDTSDTTTPYLAKVKWFWEEPTTGEIQMSLIWYYHPEHTELQVHVKGCFLPNEVLASKYFDCANVACIEDKCYVLSLNEYNRYCVREKAVNLFEHSEPVGQLKLLLNKNTPTVHHRPLPAKTVGNQNIFFCRYVYDYRVKRILKNPSLNNPIMASSM